MQISMIEDTISQMLVFNSIDEKIDKLKEWDLLPVKDYMTIIMREYYVTSLLEFTI